MTPRAPTPAAQNLRHGRVSIQAIPAVPQAGSHGVFTSPGLASTSSSSMNTGLTMNQIAPAPDVLARRPAREFREPPDQVLPRLPHLHVREPPGASRDCALHPGITTRRAPRRGGEGATTIAEDTETAARSPGLARGKQVAARAGRPPPPARATAVRRARRPPTRLARQPPVERERARGPLRVGGLGGPLDRDAQPSGLSLRSRSARAAASSSSVAAAST